MGHYRYIVVTTIIVASSFSTLAIDENTMFGLVPFTTPLGEVVEAGGYKGDKKAVYDVLSPEVQGEDICTNEVEITVKSHAITTFSPTTQVSKVGVTASKTRNYELYLPDTPELRAQLPITFQTAIEGEVIKLGDWSKSIDTLPVKIKVEEPVEKTLILTVQQF